MVHPAYALGEHDLVYARAAAAITCVFCQYVSQTLLKII